PGAVRRNADLIASGRASSRSAPGSPGRFPSVWGRVTEERPGSLRALPSVGERAIEERPRVPRGASERWGARHRGAPRVPRGASERWGVWGALVAPHLQQVADRQGQGLKQPGGEPAAL